MEIKFTTMLTAEQRIEAYEYAMDGLVNSPATPFMCNYLERWLRSARLEWCGGAVEAFNEFALFCDNSYLPLLDTTERDNIIREIILLFCIEIAKDEIAAQPFNKLKNEMI